MQKWINYNQFEQRLTHVHFRMFVDICDYNEQDKNNGKKNKLTK